MADSNRSQPKSAFQMLLQGLPDLTAEDPVVRPMWMLVPGAGSHGALVLSSSRKWFQKPQQNRREKEPMGIEQVLPKSQGLWKAALGRLGGGCRRLHMASCRGPPRGTPKLL